MKARQKNKQSRKYKLMFKWQRDFMAQCVPIPGGLLKRMAEIRAKAQENREKEDDK